MGHGMVIFLRVVVSKSEMATFFAVVRVFRMTAIFLFVPMVEGIFDAVAAVGI